MAIGALLCHQQDEDYHRHQSAGFELVVELAFGLLRAKYQQVGGVTGPVVAAQQIALDENGLLENGKGEE